MTTTPTPVAAIPPTWAELTFEERAGVVTFWTTSNIADYDGTAIRTWWNRKSEGRLKAALIAAFRFVAETARALDEEDEN